MERRKLVAEESSKGSTNDDSESLDKIKKNELKLLKKDRKRRHESSNSEIDESSSDEELKRKERKKLKKEKRKAKKKAKKKKKKHKAKKEAAEKAAANAATASEPAAETIGPVVPEEITENDKSKSFCPMTKEEWEKKQNNVRRVFDPESGRSRLVKGDGEILEEPVSRTRHYEINKQATAADGSFFQSQISKSVK